MNKKNLFYWSLYDFANSFVFINFLLYFSQWLVLDGGMSDFWYNAIFAISSILLLFTAPTLASFTDKHGGRKYYLTLSTIGTFIGYTIATVLAYYNQSILLIALFFLIGQYFYQLSFSFFNPMIEDVADMPHRARASGIGQFSNSLGQIIALAIALPLSQSRLDPLLPSVILFMLLSLPMLLKFQEGRVQQMKLSLKEAHNGTKNFFKKLSVFSSASVAVPMIVAYFFYNDALVTISNNYSLYLQQVFSMPDATKNLLLMAVLVMSALGGLAFGKIADKIGTLKSLKYILLFWLLLLPLLAFAQSFIALTVYSALLGFFMGGMTATTRAYLSQILKKEELGYGFTFYNLFERFATFLGPLTWGGIIVLTGSSSMSYRIAMISMTFYIVLGLVVLHYWRRNQNRTV